MKHKISFSFNILFYLIIRNNHIPSIRDFFFNFIIQTFLNYNFSIIRQRIELLNLEMKKSIPRMHFNKYVNFKKSVFPNNYSITKIPDIKIKKVVLPETLNHRNKIIKMSKSSLLNSKGQHVMSNHNHLLSKKNFFQSAENITNTKSVNKNTVNNYNITKKLKNEKYKIGRIGKNNKPKTRIKKNRKFKSFNFCSTKG